MNKQGWIIAFAVAAVAAPTLAVAGPPRWCKGGTDAGGEDLRRLNSGGDAEDIVGEIAKVTCSSSSEIEPHRAEIDKARAAWGAKLGMTDADWNDALAYADSDHSFKADLSAKGLDKLTPVDQFKAIHDAFEDITDPLYVADALDARLTEAGRVAFVMWCMQDDNVARPLDGNVVKWAACQGDIDKLDLGKLASELRGDTAHDGAARMWIRLHAYELTKELKDYAAKKAKLLKKDDEYGKVFEAAKKAREDWAKTLGTNKELLALVESTDSGVLFHSRKLLDGCEAKTTDALAKAIATMPAKTFATMHDDREDPYKGFATGAGPRLAGNPLVHLAAIAYVECQPKSGTGDFLGEFIQRVPGWRGPRDAAIGAISNTQLKFDDTTTKPLDFPNLENRPYRRVGGNSGSAGGVVKSTKLAGDKLEVNLEKTTRTVDVCTKEHRGNTARIYWGSGRVEWDMICDASKPMQIENTWLNFTVNKKWQKLLRPGTVFSANYGADDTDVLAIWPSKTAKLPSWVLGAKLR
ncbi:MAG: hypothetical protein ACM31C_27020 [Acidobacteriota bacterium]